MTRLIRVRVSGPGRKRESPGALVDPKLMTVDLVDIRPLFADYSGRLYDLPHQAWPTPPRCETDSEGVPPAF